MTAEEVEEILGPEAAAAARAQAIAHGPLTEAQIELLVRLLEAPVATVHQRVA